MRSVVCSCVVVFLLALSAAAAPKPSSKPADAKTISFAGVDYLHRWSQNGQNEFTPQGNEDLEKWTDMVTINVFPLVKTGDGLAELANKVLSNYQASGQIVRTDSKPRTPGHPAEHLAVAILGDPNFLEAAFARFMLVDGGGIVIVYSHRVYGKKAGNTMSAWLEKNGPDMETKLMSWDKVPSVASLQALPQSK